MLTLMSEVSRFFYSFSVSTVYKYVDRLYNLGIFWNSFFTCVYVVMYGVKHYISR